MKLGGCTTSACLRGEQRVVHSPVSVSRGSGHTYASSTASENVTFGPRATRHLQCILSTGAIAREAAAGQTQSAGQAGCGAAHQAPGPASPAGRSAERGGTGTGPGVRSGQLERKASGWAERPSGRTPRPAHALQGAPSAGRPMGSGAVGAVLVIIASGVAFKGSTAESRSPRPVLVARHPQLFAAKSSVSRGTTRTRHRPPRVERVQAHYGCPLRRRPVRRGFTKLRTATTFSRPTGSKAQSSIDIGSSSEALAPRGTVAGTNASVSWRIRWLSSTASSGASWRNCFAFSRPWPSCSPS